MSLASCILADWVWSSFGHLSASLKMRSDVKVSPSLSARKAVSLGSQPGSLRQPRRFLGAATDTEMRPAQWGQQRERSATDSLQLITHHR